MTIQNNQQQQQQGPKTISLPTAANLKQNAQSQPIILAQQQQQVSSSSPTSSPITTSNSNKPNSIVIRQTQGQQKTHLTTTKPATIASTLAMNQANSSNSSSVESLMKNQQLNKQPIILQPTAQLNSNQQQAPVQISSVSVTALNTSSSSSNLSQQSTSSSTNSTQFTIKPINNLSLSSLALQPQNKPGILTASQQQGITQFKIMSSNAANTNQTNQSNIILQTAGSTSSPQQANTIRKVGSSGNLSNLQQKVQVINSMKPTIQILSNSGQRVTKTTTITTSTNANAIATNSNLPQQYQQVFQQQTSKLNPQQPSS